MTKEQIADFVSGDGDKIFDAFRRPGESKVSVLKVLVGMCVFSDDAQPSEKVRQSFDPHRLACL